MEQNQEQGWFNSVVLYTLHELAAYLQVHPNTLRSLVKRHALPAP